MTEEHPTGLDRVPTPVVDEPARSDEAGQAHAAAGERVPRTGDIVVDAALGELARADADDLDAQLVAGESVHRSLQARLADLGG